MGAETLDNKNKLRGKVRVDEIGGRKGLEISDGKSYAVIWGKTEDFNNWMSGNPGMNLKRFAEQGELQIIGDLELIKRSGGDFVSLSFDMFEDTGLRSRPYDGE